jgi:hypothetical protein
MIDTVKALAAAFEAAWKEEVDLPDDCSNEQVDDAVERTAPFVGQIVQLRGTDISILRLKARAYLWGYSGGDPESFCEHVDDTPSADNALVSLFRDLGADFPVGGEPVEDKVAA